MSPSTDRAASSARLKAGMAELGLAATPDQIERLLDYVELLFRWNATYNLTAVREFGEMIDRHVLDSLAIAKFVQGETLADLGSGAGLPGIPLAILEPARSYALIDSNGKKARFLREAVRVLSLPNVRVENARVEDVTGQFDTVTARAFAGVAEMVKLGGHLLARDGILLAMKGLLNEQEILDMPPDFTVASTLPLHVPGTDKARHLVIVRRATILKDHAA
jgi:16S rRNA (guanine527-N7)-methyltransferase